MCAVVSKTGGADRDRTDDPLLAKQVLSQLSYSPVINPSYAGIPTRGSSVEVAHTAALRDRLSAEIRAKSGGSGRTRTTDLTLIRGAL